MDFVNSLPGAVALGLIWGIMAIGVYITYRVLDVADLTVDGSMVTGAVVSAVLIVAGVNPFIAVLCAFLAGALCGFITGIFHTVLGIPAILSGILSQLALWSLNLKILGKSNQSLSSRTFDVILTQLDKGLAIVWAVLFLIAIIGLLYWFFGTERGCSIRATGNNLNMSRAQGINTDVNKVIGLMISNALVALSGALLAQYQGFADINMGRGAIVIGLAAVIIGEVLVSKVSKNFAIQLIGVALGGVIYYVVYQLIVWLGLDTDLLKMLSALVVAIFLAVPYLKKKYFSKRQTQKAIDALKESQLADTPQAEENIVAEGEENA